MRMTLRHAARVYSRVSLMLLCGLWATPTRSEVAAPVKTGEAWGTKEYQRSLDRGTPATVSGKVLSMDELMVYEDREPGVQVRLDVGGEEVHIHLGPRWFILQHDLNLTRGEPLTVVGVKINFGAKPTVVAKEVTQGERTVILRELSGTPRWQENGPDSAASSREEKKTSRQK